jgi:enoyl-CoA hydratase/carnithine racemase
MLTMLSAPIGPKPNRMIKFNVEDRVGTIVIERASAGNAFTEEMVRQLGEIIRRAAEEADIVTLSGAGADFTIGRDRGEPKSGSPFDAFRNISALNKTIAEFPGVLITGVRGRAFGLGIGLILRSDIAIAAADARFALDEVKIGIPPMFIMEQILEYLPAKRALDFILTGREFGADEALQIGLVSRVVGPDDLDGTMGEFVATLRSRDRRVVLACKRYLRAVGKMPPEARSAYALVEQTQFAMGDSQ